MVPDEASADEPDELPGVVLLQYVRCGKPGCRCASRRSEDAHGPYHYHFYRDADGHLRKRYVRAADVEATRRACQRRQQREQRERARSQRDRLKLRAVRDLLREVEDGLKRYA